MKTLPFVYIQTKSEYNDLKITLEKKLGQGAFGITYLTTRNNEKRVVKFLTSSKEDVLKEAVIGYELKQRLPEKIREYFTGVFALIICKNFSIPKEIIESIELNDDLKENFKNAKEFYIIEQELISNAKTGMEWLASQQFSVSEEVVRSIMFQLVISLCYAQHVLGFQHNDLKLENLMFVENKTNAPIYKSYQFPDGDIFELHIPTNGVEIRLIDFGASSLFGANNQPAYINPTTAHTAGYIPFEYMFYPDYDLEDQLLNLRLNDADIPGLFKIMLNIIAHNKNGWKYLIGSDGTGEEYGQISTTPDIVDSLKSLFEKTLFNPKPEDMEQKDYEADKESRVVAILGEAAILFNLGISLKYPENKYLSLSKLGDKAIKTIEKNYALLTDTRFKQAIESITKFNNITDLLTNPIELHFIRALARPFPLNRQSFGVPVPFDRYSLANALYHPFFAYYYWKKEISQPLLSIDIIPGPALVFRETKDQKSVPKKFAVLYEKKFNDLMQSTQKKKDEDDSEVTPPSSVKPTGGKRKETAPYKIWVQKDFDDLVLATVAKYSLNDYLGMTDKQIDDLIDNKVLKAIVDHLKTLDSAMDKISKASNTSIQSGLKDYFAKKRTELGSTGPSVTPSSSNKPNEKPSEKEKSTVTPYKVWVQKDFDDLEVTTVAKYSLNDYLGITDTQIDDLIDNKVLKAIVDYLKTLDSAMDKISKASNTSIQSGLKDYFAKKRAELGSAGPSVTPSSKKGKKKPKKAKSPIFEQLESIEHHPGFIIPEADNVFDTLAISDELYVPLREAVSEHPELTKVASHLGIDKPLFDYPLVDMTKRSNQIRYLHTLSVLAEMVESQNITPEKIERCFVEWPPTPQYRMGEVNEI